MNDSTLHFTGKRQGDTYYATLKPNQSGYYVSVVIFDNNRDDLVHGFVEGNTHYSFTRYINSHDSEKFRTYFQMVKAVIRNPDAF